jgi:DnaJ-domain-containing protein 1
VIYLALGAAILALLVWAGRRSKPLGHEVRAASALFSALAAAGAVVAGLRGVWVGSLILLVISAYLGQTARRGRQGPSTEARGGGMSDREARAILGVGETADRSEIETAYKRLMRLNHPDHGGSSGLAAQLNAARDRLIK